MEKSEKTLELTLDSKTTAVVNNLARWTKRTGLIIIIFGLIYCIAVFMAESNFLGAIITLGFGIFAVYVGTRLTAASGYLIDLLKTGNQENLFSALENMRQFFRFTGIIMATFTILIIITILAITILGLSIQEFGLQ